MKIKMKNFKGLLFVCVMVLCSMSCSNESIDIQESKEVKMESFDNLKKDFMKLNETYEDNNLVSTNETRFKFKKWFRALVVCVTDVACFVVDGKIGTSIAASAAANNLLTNLEEKFTNKNKEPIKSSALNNVENGSTGFIHNKALMNLYEIYGDSLELLSTEELLNASMREVSALTEQPYTPATEKTCKLVDDAVTKLDFDKTVSENMLSLKSLTDDVVKQEELDICGVILEGLQMVNDEDETYYSSALELINESDIPISEKKVMQEGLSIGYASAKLWNTDIEE